MSEFHLFHLQTQYVPCSVAGDQLNKTEERFLFVMKRHAHFCNEPTVITWKQEKYIYSVLKT
jgi:hypothetical protein